VLVVGSDALAQAVEDAGLVPVRSATEQPQAVLQGWGPQVGWAELAQASYAIGEGAAYFATNLDRTLPTERGFAPGNGSMIAAVVSATGVQPIASGKPDPAIFAAAARRVDAVTPLVVGDRLSTDLAGANRAGYPGLLVLTGVSCVLDLLQAPAEFRPNYLGADLRALHLAQPACQPVAAGWAVGGACCQLIDDQVVFEQAAQTDQLDAVRAAAALAWQIADTQGLTQSLLNQLMQSLRQVEKGLWN
jgi:ribonucleotide monophosphatase NagD (HAD superfamily)